MASRVACFFRSLRLTGVRLPTIGFFSSDVVMTWE